MENFNIEIAIDLLNFVNKNYSYEYGYKHNKYGWHVFGNIYTEQEVINDFLMNYNKQS